MAAASTAAYSQSAESMEQQREDALSNEIVEASESLETKMSLENCQLRDREIHFLVLQHLHQLFSRYQVDEDDGSQQSRQNLIQQQIEDFLLSHSLLPQRLSWDAKWKKMTFLQLV